MDKINSDVASICLLNTGTVPNRYPYLVSSSYLSITGTKEHDSKKGRYPVSGQK